MSAERIDPPLYGDEATMMRAFLDYHRDTFRSKCAGLDAEQLDSALAPSEMTLGGMMKHLALVESNWFSHVFKGNPDVAPWDSVDWDADADWDWHSAKHDSPEDLRRLFDESVAASDAILDLGDPLETPSVQTSRRTGEGKFSLRWIILHMIEEYARHNGHADLIREAIDGQTGE
ncbi:putative damage-inducible protein DinB [Nocardioides daedukensis]|uniref:Putative damage-inducible protein DinB n=1 Tax=Nocardioides daedukensis TaxID=634462 RepID=A0A7Y9RZR9_9ACTN|nr:DinB family protein [Nocardioides daedukensis]NYG58471.1 putative damage-inducible protein DinB [Nocardioides daedukensis]